MTCVLLYVTYVIVCTLCHFSNYTCTFICYLCNDVYFYVTLQGSNQMDLTIFANTSIKVISVLFPFKKIIEAVKIKLVYYTVDTYMIPRLCVILSMCKVR